MDRFRIAVTEDLMQADGSIAFPDYSFGPLTDDPSIGFKRLACGRVIRGADLEDVDLLISVPMTAAVTAESFPLSQRLLAILRVGVGYEDVDVDACTRNGVALIIPTDAVRRPTAIAALTLMLALATRLLDKHRLTLEGPSAWQRRVSLRGVDLDGKVLGLVGCGSIGSELTRLCSQLGMRIVATDPRLSTAQAEALGVELLPLPKLLATSDFVSIHCPLNSSTRGAIAAEQLRLMKPSSYLINTARGGIVDQSALAEALRVGRIAGAGLDVFAEEPPAPGDPILACGNVVFSAHSLNWTKELDVELGRSNVRAVEQLMSGSLPSGLVNAEVASASAFLSKLRAIAEAIGKPGARAKPTTKGVNRRRERGA